MKEFDLHGYTKAEVLVFLQELDKNDKVTKKFHFITGKGNHTRNKPQMDYATSITWKCPIKETIIDYIVYQKQEGSRMFEKPASIFWHRKFPTGQLPWGQLPTGHLPQEHI